MIVLGLFPRHAIRDRNVVANLRSDSSGAELGSCSNGEIQRITIALAAKPYVI